MIFISELIEDAIILFGGQHFHLCYNIITDKASIINQPPNNNELKSPTNEQNTYTHAQTVVKDSVTNTQLGRNGTVLTSVTEPCYIEELLLGSFPTLDEDKNECHLMLNSIL